MPASTAAARCRRRRCCMALGMDGEEILDDLLRPDRPTRAAKDGWRMPFNAERMRGVKADDRPHRRRQTGEVVARGRQEAHRARRPPARREGREGAARHRRGPARPLPRRGHRQRCRPARSTPKPATSSTEKLLAGAHGGAASTSSPSSTSTTSTSAPTSATRSPPTRTRRREEALFDIYRVMRPGEPPTIETAEAMFQSLFFDPERYDLSAVGRVKMNMRLDLDAEDTVRTLRKEDILAVVQDAGRPARRQGRDRRHRQSRQPPRPFGRRADGEPVSPRPPAHGARHQGAHVVGRDRHGDAAGPDQRQAGGGGRARVLRLLAALAVHGPDQPAVRDHPQAPPVGARPGRPDPRARGLRGARRPPDPLRPHLPDRDAGRPEHRPDQLARDLRARQQVRLHREPLPQGRWTARSPTRSSISRRWRRRSTHVAQANAVIGDDGMLDRRTRDLPPGGRRHRGPARQGRPHGRVAQAARFGRRGADPVPRERRRQPRADGLEHAAPGSAAGARRGAVRRHRHGSGRRARFGRRDRRPPHRRRRPGGCDAHRHPRDGRDRPGASPASTSTACRSSSAPTRTPASTSVRW